MDVRKEIIRPGVYTYLGASGLPERLTVTNDTIKHFHDSGKAMLADKLSIPIPLEHQPTAVVQTESERAANQLLNNAGFVKDYEVVKVKNDAGVMEDRLFSILDIPDKAILAKLPTTIRSVSPWINSFVDGNGKTWNGVISHVALTTRPRIAKQANFESTGAAMSMLGAMQDKNLNAAAGMSSIANGSGGFALSHFTLLKKDADKFKPTCPIAFSLINGIKLSEDDLKDIEDDDDEGGAGDSEGSAEGSEGDDAIDQFAGDDTAGVMDAESGDVSFEELIPHLLEMHGISVPAGGKGKDFLQALVRGLLASAKSFAANDGGDDATVLGDDPAAKPAKGPVTQEAPPMYMSLTAAEVAKITDPAQKQIAEAFLSLRTVNEAVSKNILDDAGKYRQARIERLCRRLPVAARDKLVAALGTTSAQLSLGSDGKVRDPMNAMLEIFEAGIPDLPAMLKKGVKLSEVDQPEDGVISDSRAEELANKMLGRHAETAAAK